MVNAAGDKKVDAMLVGQKDKVWSTASSFGIVPKKQETPSLPPPPNAEEAPPPPTAVSATAGGTSELASMDELLDGLG